jgi:hypothetical protein
MIQNILEKTFYTMSRKLHLFNQEQSKLVWHDKRADQIRLKNDNNINVKLQPWITKKKS